MSREIYHMNLLYVLTTEERFQKTNSQWKLDYGFFTALPGVIVARDFCRVHSISKEASYLPLDNKYYVLKTTCRIKLKFFLWTKLLKKWLPLKYIRSVATTLKVFQSVMSGFLWTKERISSGFQETKWKKLPFVNRGYLDVTIFVQRTWWP